MDRRLGRRRITAGLPALLLTIGITTVGAVGAAAPTGAATVFPDFAPVSLPIDGTPAGVAVDPAAGDAWISETNGSIVQVEEGNGIATTSFSPGASAAGDAVDPGANVLDIADPADGALQILNESTGATEFSPTLGGDPVAVAATGGTAYVANDETSGTVVEVDEATGVVTDTVGVGSHPASIAVDASTEVVAVANKGSGTLSLITTDGTMTVDVGGAPDAVAVDPATGLIAVANATGGTVSLVDEGTASVVATVPVGTDPVSLAVDTTTGQFAAANEGSGTVSVLSEATQSVEATLAAGSNPVALAFDIHRGLIQVANQADLLTTLQDSQATTITQTMPSDPTAVGVNSSTDQVAVALPSSDRLRLSAGFGAKAQELVPIGTGPYSIAVDETTGNWFVSNGGSGTVTIVSSAGAVLGIINVGTDPGEIVVDPVTARAFVACPGSHEFVAIDEATGAKSVVKITNVTVSGIAVDPATATVFVAEASKNKIAAFAEGSTKSAWNSSTAPTTPGVLVYDSEADSVLAGSPSSSSLLTLGATSRSLGSVPLPAPAAGLAVDTTSGLAWISSASGTELFEVDLGSGAVLATLPVAGIAGVGFDDTLDRAIFSSTAGGGSLLRVGGPTVPGSPTDIVTEPGDGTVSVTWDGAPPGDDPITGYVVAVYAEGTETAVKTTTTTTTSATFAHLTDGQAYVIVVVGKSSAGAGQTAFSAPVTPATVPDPPAHPTAVAGHGSAVVSWSPPDTDGGYQIQSYTVTPFDGTTAEIALAVTVSGSPPATQATVTGLTNGTPYTFEVIATNRIGPSVESAATKAVTPLGAPGAPTGVTATSQDASAEVSWNAPASNGGANVTSYTVTPSHDGTPLPDLAVVVSGHPPATSTNVPGLTNGEVYTFSVVATNSIGSSAGSVPSAGCTPASAPFAPTKATAAAGDGQATVSWKAPGNDGGSRVTGYIVTPIKAGVPDPARAVTVSGTTTSVVVRRLEDGVPYGFSVVAENKLGVGTATISRQVIPVHGLWIANSAGRVVGVGVRSLGSGKAIHDGHYVAILSEPSRHGYLLVGSDGSVHAFGHAKSYGSASGVDVVGASLMPGGKGYIMFLAGGGVKVFGDAKSHGQLSSTPISGGQLTPDGKGYFIWLTNGSVRAFGDAKLYGGLGSGPVLTGAVNPSGKGYYLLRSDGEVHRFGGASYFGSTKALGYRLAPAALVVLPHDNGYLECTSNGYVFGFGAAAGAYADRESAGVSGTTIGIGIEP